eukprot:742323-Pelagomonas_calceolata.AAC.1
MAPPITAFYPDAIAPAAGEGWCWCLNVRRLRLGVATAGAAVVTGRAGEGLVNTDIGRDNHLAHHNITFLQACTLKGYKGKKGLSQDV